MQARSITPTLAIADQPSEADFRELKNQGYVGIVNLRHDGEPEQPLSTLAEGELVRSLGMEYLHYGVGGVPLVESGVSAVCDFLDRHETQKVLVHCRRAHRAAGLVLIYHARKHAWTAAEALTRARELGLEVDGPLKAMVEAYLVERDRQGQG
jgi:uncharacterized protein (TIGR01244 family)